MSKKNVNKDYQNLLKERLQQAKQGNSRMNKKVFETYTTYDATLNKQSDLIDLDLLFEASNEWNFFDKHNDDKMYELINSILDNGLLNPIIVWEREENYMILAGHNRVEAFKKLYDMSNDDNFLKIPAFIYKKNEIDEIKARTIIIDTNYVQRKLSTKELQKCIVIKYDELSGKRKNVKDSISEELNISPRTVVKYRNLEKLIPEIKELVFNNKLGINNALKLIYLQFEEQRELYNEYKDYFNNSIFNKIKNDMSKSQIEKIICYKDDIQEIIDVKISIPKIYKDEFIKKVNDWAKEKGIEKII